MIRRKSPAELVQDRVLYVATVGLCALGIKVAGVGLFWGLVAVHALQRVVSRFVSFSASVAMAALCFFHIKHRYDDMKDLHVVAASLHLVFTTLYKLRGEHGHSLFQAVLSCGLAVALFVSARDMFPGHLSSLQVRNHLIAGILSVALLALELLIRYEENDLQQTGVPRKEFVRVMGDIMTSEAPPTEQWKTDSAAYRRKARKQFMKQDSFVKLVRTMEQRSLGSTMQPEDGQSSDAPEDTTWTAAHVPSSVPALA